MTVTSWRPPVTTRVGIAALIAALSVLAALLLAPATAAFAAPEDEGGTAELRKKLDSAARGYNDAKGRLGVSQKKQADLAKQAKSVENEVAVLSVRVDALARAAYKGDDLSALNVILESESVGAFMQASETMAYLTRRDGRAVTNLKKLKIDLAAQKARVDAEVATQSKHTAEMAKKKKEAEDALAEAGGFPVDGPGGGLANSAPAPRNPDGSWPNESCNQTDPTVSGGCLTPRTRHALQQVQQVGGYKRYVSCYRAYNDGGEHPQGRACDFAAQSSGFGGDATGDDYLYGQKLAGWLIANADNLAVLYIIWYRKIWQGGSWSTYYCGGDASSCHTNHVHLSVQ